MGLNNVWPKVGIIDPYPVQDDAHTPCQGNHGALATTASGNLRAWYVQDIAFYAICEAWLEPRTS
jgi:hypothetical protein